MKKALKIKRIISLNMQSKMIFISMLSSLIIFGFNLYMYLNINIQTKNIDQIYVSNVSLNELQNTIKSVQNSMSGYLKTKSSDSMEEYFRNQQECYNLIRYLNNTVTNDEGDLIEKNIKNMSESYLELTYSTVEAKRGRRIEKYNELYEESSELYKYLNSTIYTLNNSKFQENYKNYVDMLASLHTSEFMNIVILFFIGAINILFIIFFSKSITRPLKKLARLANKVARGELDIELMEVEVNDEVGIVTSAFNKMVINLRNFIEQLKISIENENEMKKKELLMETHLKDAQLKYLRAQINPHFLFNTLNAGAQLAMMEGADRTYAYILNVADFFRYNLSMGKDMVSLHEEIKLVDNYMYILNVRFSNELRYIKEVDEELINVQVPIMILQPIVENCINYGVRDIEREKLIGLSVYRNGDCICISISDNGLGISKEKIEGILQGKVKSFKKDGNSNGIGLINIISRLKMVYEIDKVIEIKSEGENLGTTVTIFIPLEERGE